MKRTTHEIFTTRAFNRLDVAGELGDADLIAAIAEMNDGLSER